MLAGVDAQASETVAQASETVHVQESSTSSVQLRRQIASELRAAMTSMEKVKKLNELLAAVESKAKGGTQLADSTSASSEAFAGSSSSSQATDTPAEQERKRIEGMVDDEDVYHNQGWLWGVNPVVFLIVAMIITPCLGVAVIKGCWAMIDLMAPFG